MSDFFDDILGPGDIRHVRRPPVGRFPLGQVVATPGAIAVMVRAGIDPLELVARHVRGDWGDISPEDAKDNELSLREGYRIFSAYGGEGSRLWVITEADRSVTTILRPEDY